MISKERQIKQYARRQQQIADSYPEGSKERDWFENLAQNADKLISPTGDSKDNDAA